MKRPCCWDRLRAGGDGDDRGWDGWMASATQWTWIWVSFGSWWWLGRSGLLQSMGLQRVGHKLDWTDLREEVNTGWARIGDWGGNQAGWVKLCRDETIEKHEAVQIEKKREAWYEEHAKTKGKRLQDKGVCVFLVWAHEWGSCQPEPGSRAGMAPWEHCLSRTPAHSHSHVTLC